MILIISDAHDAHADVVQEKLNKLGFPVYRFNLDVHSLRNTTITYSQQIWKIIQNGHAVSNTEITAVWTRRAFVELLLEEKNSADSNFLLWKNEWNKVLLGFYFSISTIPTLCPLKPSYAAENKFQQIYLAKSIGFNVPATITSNDKNELIKFAQVYQNNVVLKLHHQDFYKTDSGYVGIYVNKVTADMLDEFSDHDENPITLQEYIEKAFEIRYTVVGNCHFCCKIDSQKSERTKIDWRRYDIPNTPHSIIEPPEAIKIRVSNLMEKLNLNYGALDFIVDNKNQWYFLEINSMGQWLWIEDLTGLKISDAICNWLISNS